MKKRDNKYFKPIIILVALFVLALISVLVILLKDSRTNNKIDRGNQAAVITVNNDEVDMFPKSIFTVKPTLKLGGVVKEDVDYEWMSADESIAVVKEGRITAVGVGVTTITVSAKEYEHTDKEIVVNVRDDYTLDLSEWELILGVADLFGYQKSTNVSVIAKKEGKIVKQPNIKIEMDESVATFKQEDDKFHVTAVAKGQNNAKVTWEYEGKTIYTELPITVEKPRTTATEIYWISVSDKRDTSIHLSHVQAELPNGTKASNAIGITDEDGNQFNVTSAGKEIFIRDGIRYGDAGEEHTFNVEFDVFELILPIKCATLAIRTTDDFYSLPKYYDKDTHAIDGLYVLCNNLDFAGKKGFDTFCGYSQNGKKSGGYIGWIGTFDGQGHVIKNLTLNANSDQGGIFGSLGVNGIVKNVAFSNGINNASGGYLFNYIYGTVDNVFVASTATKGVSAAGPSAVLAQRLNYKTAKVSNVTAVALNDPENYNYSLVGFGMNDELFKTVFTGPTISIGAKESQVIPIYKTAAEMSKKNSNVMVYSADKVAKVVELETNGSASFSQKNGIFYTYYNGVIVYARSLKEDTQVYDYSLSKGVIDFGLVHGINAEDIKGMTHLDGTKIKYTKEGHLVKIAGDTILNAEPKSASGSITTIIVKTKKGDVQLSLRTATLAIRTTEDFFSLPKYYDKEKYAIEGYYVLANDLDFAGENGFNTFCGYRENGGKSGGYRGWVGTFDGQGHVIRNLVLNANSDQGGVFGSLGVAGVVKNVAFADGINNGTGGYLFNYIYGKVENVFVAASVTKGISAAGPSAVLTQRLNYKTADIGNVTVVALNELEGYNYTLVGSGITEELFKSVFTGKTVSLGATGTQIVPLYKTAGEIMDSNSKILPYAPTPEMYALAAKYAHNGNTTFAQKDGIFYAYYNGTIVYAKSVAKNVQTYDYSLSKGSIDFSLVKGLEATDIKGITHLDGRKIAYSVEGNIVKVTGDITLNATPKSASGAITTILIDNGEKKVQLSLKVATLAIRTTDDFYSMADYLENKSVQGYFILSNDLDFTGLPEFTTYCGTKQVGSGGNAGWRAVFDGQNHIIKNLSLQQAWNSGIFGNIGFTGKVQNVAFTGVVNKAYGGYLCEAIYGTVENIYVEGICTQTSYRTPDKVAMMGSLFSGQVAYANATVKHITVVATGKWSSYNRALASVGTEFDGCIVAIAPAENQILGTYDTIADIKAKNKNVQAYVTMEDAAKANIEQCGSTTFDTKDNVFYINFGTSCVYKEAINLIKLDAYDYSLGKGTIDFSLIDGVNASEVTGIEYKDWTPIKYSISGDIITIQDDDVLNADKTKATGEVVSIIVSTKNAKYELPLRVVTLAIRTTDDFYSLPNYVVDNKVEGYFILCNDLDFAGLSEFATYCGSKQVGTGGNVGWRATFDGQNHVISNLSLKQTWNSGIFGLVGFKGIVKNVAFTGAVNKAYGGYLFENIYGTVENIYVEGICTQTAYKNANQLSMMGSLFSNSIGYANATIKNITVMATGDWATYNRALASSGNAVDGTTVVIGMPENQILGAYTTIKEIHDANENIKAYETIVEAAKSNLVANGSTTYCTENNMFCAYFGETCVYEEEMKEELDTYDYSLGKGTIDFSEINEVRVSEITAIEHIDGTPIQYSINGDNVCISGDSVLNADANTANGSIVKIVVKTAYVKYELPLRVVSLAIKTTDDFYDLSNYVVNNKVEGYFILCNNLDFKDLPEFNTFCGTKQVGNDANNGWNATFDGQNHIIHNLTLSTDWNNGIFGMVGFKGVVKNVAFTGAVNKGYGGYVCDDIYGIVENVYVEGIASQTAYATAGVNTGCLFANNVPVSYATVKNITVIATGAWTHRNRALAAVGTYFDENIIVIGAEENQILGNYATIAEIQAVNANIKAYVEVIDAVNAALPTNGSTRFVVEEGQYCIYFGDVKVYQEEARGSLNTYDYSLGKGTIDFSLIDGLNASDITGMKHEDGTSIQYTKNGDIVTISQDSILNADKKTATGAVTKIYITTQNAQYELPLKVVTLAIRTTDDFYSLSSYVENKQVNGYFVLCNDLDFTGLSEFETYCGSKQLGTGGNVGWRATFDGQNHVISNLTLKQAWNSGVFGLVGFTGVVKNVAFTGAVNRAYGGYLFENIYGRVENIYVEGICTQTAYKNASQILMMGSLFSNSISYANANMRNVTVVATGNWATYNRALASSGTAIDANAIVIGPAENQILGTYATIADVQAVNSQIKAYASIQKAAEANLPINGSTRFVVESGIFHIYFGEKCVY